MPNPNNSLSQSTTGLRDYSEDPWQHPREITESIWEDSLAYTILLEAHERLTLALRVARNDIEDRLRDLIDLIPHMDERRAASNYIERLYDLRRDEIEIALKMGATTRPRIDTTQPSLEDALEMALEDALAQMGIGTPAEANEFIRGQLRLMAERVREALPDYPADWYRIEIAKQRYEDWLADIRAKTKA